MMSSNISNSALQIPKTSGFTLVRVLNSNSTIPLIVAKDPYDQHVKIRFCLANDSKSLSSLFHEADILKMLPGSPQFPKLLHFGFYSDPGEIPIFMVITEFIVGLSLMDIPKPTVSAKRTKIEQSLMDAIYLLKTKNLVHSDIKPNHIILRDDNSEPKISLIDFRFAGLSGDPRTGGTTKYLRPGVLLIGDPLNFEDDRFAAEASIEVLSGLSVQDKKMSPPFSYQSQQQSPIPANENPFI